MTPDFIRSQAPSPELPSQYVDRQGLNLDMENAGSHMSKPLVPFPNRPSCFAWYHYDPDGDDTMEDAAIRCREDWLEWAEQARTKIQMLGRTILTLAIPSQTLISLVKLLTDYPLEPIYFIIHESYRDDEGRRSSVDYYQGRLDDQWNPWAAHLDSIRQSLARVIVRNLKSQNSATSENYVDMIDLDRLSLEEPALERRNLERALRMIIESETQKARLQAQADAKAVLSTLFSADNGAELLVEMMDKADLNS